MVVALDESEMEVFDVNVGGIIKCNKAAIMYMSKRKSQGVIINTASASGKKNNNFLKYCTIAYILNAQHIHVIFY